MSDPVAIPGSRDVRGRVDRPDADRIVVACPPHPQRGGSRSDPRLRAVSDALAPDVACLRFDYGPWDGGAGERRDARNAVSWAAQRFDGVALFGYSFGAGVALRAAAVDATPAACSALAPPADDDTLAALDDVDCPGQVVVGERDETVDSRAVLTRARALGWAVETLPADHYFAGQVDRAAGLVGSFLTEQR